MNQVHFAWYDSTDCILIKLIHELTRYTSMINMYTSRMIRARCNVHVVTWVACSVASNDSQSVCISHHLILITYTGYPNNAQTIQSFRRFWNPCICVLYHGRVCTECDLRHYNYTSNEQYGYGQWPWSLYVFLSLPSHLCFFPSLTFSTRGKVTTKISILLKIHKSDSS